MHPPDRLRLIPALRRRGWLLLVSTLLVAGLAFGFATLRSRSYSTNLVLVVALHNLNQPLADEANKLANTYAGVITNDNAVLNSLGAAVGLSSTEVKENLEVTTDENTSIIHAVYTGSSEDEAVTAARALVRALTGRHPVTANVAPQTIRAVQVPTEATASGGGSSSAIAVGAVLGLFLGALLLLAWERADPRIDDAGQLAAETELATSELGALDEEALGVLRARWRELQGSPQRLTVSLVPVERRSLKAAERLKELLEHDPTLLASVGETLTAQAGAVVLVARAGAPVSATRKQLMALSNLGRPPLWAVLARRRDSSRRARRAAKPDASDTPGAPGAPTPSETPEPQGSFT